jgi:hypothetical protein
MWLEISTPEGDYQNLRGCLPQGGYSVSATQFVHGSFGFCDQDPTNNDPRYLTATYDSNYAAESWDSTTNSVYDTTNWTVSGNNTIDKYSGKITYDITGTDEAGNPVSYNNCQWYYGWVIYPGLDNFSGWGSCGIQEYNNTIISASCGSGSCSCSNYTGFPDFTVAAQNGKATLTDITTYANTLKNWFEANFTGIDNGTPYFVCPPDNSTEIGFVDLSINIDVLKVLASSNTETSTVQVSGNFSYSVDSSNNITLTGYSIWFANNSIVLSNQNDDALTWLAYVEDTMLANASLIDDALLREVAGVSTPSSITVVIDGAAGPVELPNPCIFEPTDNPNYTGDLSNVASGGVPYRSQSIDEPGTTVSSSKYIETMNLRPAISDVDTCGSGGSWVLEYTKGLDFVHPTEIKLTDETNTKYFNPEKEQTQGYPFVFVLSPNTGVGIDVPDEAGVIKDFDSSLSSINSAQYLQVVQQVSTDLGTQDATVDLLKVETNNPYIVNCGWG